MQTLTGYARLAQHGEQGYERAPWWSAKPDKIEDVEPDWADPNYVRRYKRMNDRENNRMKRLADMLSGKDSRRSNSTPDIPLSNHPAAVRSRERRAMIKTPKKKVVVLSQHPIAIRSRKRRERLKRNAAQSRHNSLPSPPPIG